MSFSSGKKAPNNISLDSSQTLSNKTLDGSTVIQDGATITTPDIISPDRLDVKKDTYANLETYASTATNGQLCFSTDTKVMYQVVDSALTEVGSGQGGINYLEGDNVSFENGVGDYVGDTNLVLSHETVAPLRGAGSLKIAKSAIDASTQSITSPTITVDTADLAKKLTGSFDYDFSDANYSDGDMRVQIIQDPAGTPSTIRVNGEDIKAGKGTHYFQFQTDSTETDYKIEILQVSTQAATVDAYIDNVVVGPTNLAYGTIVTDWETFVPGFGNVTPGTGFYSDGKFRRVGDSMEIQATFTLGTGGNVNGLIQLDMPTGYSIDQDKLVDVNNSSTGYSLVGQSYSYDASLAVLYSGTATTHAQNELFIFGNHANAGQYQQLIPFDWADGDQFQTTITVPIQGWSSNAQMSEDLGGREVAVRMYLNSATNHTTSGSYTKVPLDAVTHDTVSWADTGNNRINIGESGYYNINALNAFTSISDGKLSVVAVYKNGSILQYGTNQIQGASTGSNTSLSDVRYLEKGDYLELFAYQNDSASEAYAVGDDAIFLSVHKLASPQTILETETVAARYTSNAGQSLNWNASVPIIFEDKSHDTHNAMNTGTGVYTVPTSGMYQINARITLAPSQPNDGELFAIRLRLNGAVINEEILENTPGGTTSKWWSISVSDTVQLEKGDEIYIDGYQSIFDPLSLDTAGYRNIFTIARMK